MNWQKYMDTQYSTIQYSTVQDSKVGKSYQNPLPYPYTKGVWGAQMVDSGF
jgi:hypothetical protein